MERRMSNETKIRKDTVSDRTKKTYLHIVSVVCLFLLHRTQKLERENKTTKVLTLKVKLSFYVFASHQTFSYHQHKSSVTIQNYLPLFSLPIALIVSQSNRHGLFEESKCNFSLRKNKKTNQMIFIGFNIWWVLFLKNLWLSLLIWITERNSRFCLICIKFGIFI